MTNATTVIIDHDMARWCVRPAHVSPADSTTYVLTARSESGSAPRNRHRAGEAPDKAVQARSEEDFVQQMGICRTPISITTRTISAAMLGPDR